jgi:hypothetical protein
MATIKLGTTGSANRLISYAEKKAVEREGVNCNHEYAKSQFATTRELHGKTGGIQAHHIIQSFKPGEITPDQANKVGVDLAKNLAKGHECVVYTHADKDHIHNHIVINSVNHENGKKLHLHGQQAIDKVRGLSDELCKERGLSVVKEPTSKVRYTLAEQGILKRGETSWKDELRQAIDYEKAHSKSYEDFKNNLTEKYGIEVKERGKHISYKHPDYKKFVRGKTLGLDYERGTIEHGFSRQIESSKEHGAELERARELADGNQRTQQAHAELHKGSYERGYREKGDGRKRTGKHEKDQSRDTRENGIDIAKAREHAENLRRQSSSSYGNWKNRNDKEQSRGINSNEPNRENAQGKLQRDGKEVTKQLERSKTRGWDLSR